MTIIYNKNTARCAYKNNQKSSAYLLFLPKRMQQRCIGRETARKLLLCAFFDDVMRTLPDEQMQENLLDKINEYIG